MSIPIIDTSGRVVGWTDTAPSVVDGRLRHDAAAALLNADLTTINVELTEPEQVMRAGAPNHWARPWHCLAICPAGAPTPFRN